MRYGWSNRADFTHELCQIIRYGVSERGESSCRKHTEIWVTTGQLLTRKGKYLTIEGTTGEFTSASLAFFIISTSDDPQRDAGSWAAFNASLTNTKHDYMYSPYAQSGRLCWVQIVSIRILVGEWFAAFAFSPAAECIIGAWLTQFHQTSSGIGGLKAFGALRSFFAGRTEWLTENLLIPPWWAESDCALSYALVISFCRSFSFREPCFPVTLQICWYGLHFCI